MTTLAMQPQSATVRRIRGGTLYTGLGCYAACGLFAVAVPEPRPFQWLIFGLLAALASAMVANEAAGQIQIRSKTLRASGSFAIFCLVFGAVVELMPQESGGASPPRSDVAPTLAELETATDRASGPAEPDEPDETDDEAADTGEASGGGGP